MNHTPNELKINWSVWDNNSSVSWSYAGIPASVSMKLPPISVTHLESKSLLAVVGDFIEFGSENLLLFSYDGLLQKKVKAPTIEKNAHFGTVSEDDGKIKATLGYQSGALWKEIACDLDLENGTANNFHRSY